MNIAPFRVGQIVPSSNTTMETEVPALLRGHAEITGSNFTFHSSRMRMKRVTREELAAMDADSDRCALELSDARMDVMGYACLVAIMSMGHGYHRESQRRLQQRTEENGAPTPVVTSAGALIDGLSTLRAKKIAIIAPYMRPLTQVVVDYIEAEGFEVCDRIALEIEDNLEVGRRDPLALIDIADRLVLANVDAVVLSACVQMPSLEAVPIVERKLGLPVISSAICTAFRMLEELGLETVAPDAGALLSGTYSRPLDQRQSVARSRLP
jgi:maleate isomerase